ncbi:cytochrome b/b6 domain-containing protein [Paraburkholderia diazotrophica]|uniref:Cytochrome b n=1 Tax=Paraburkholderia diazotrophica TaxID=667676 RepID=A0A1H7C342_9BURK|nr:cytochrome b/b6 domain-containing protein [Paraburkholderia diazotrophica]SEJ83704.1 Cytochrome b [Paraburkholderia diazotrophica]
MNTSSAYPNSRDTRDTTDNRILVWDLPVRLFHWLMAACFAGAFLTAESEHWRLVHVTLGYTVGGLVLFRLVWGLVGTRYARFASFIGGPSSVWRYLRGVARAHPDRHVGHNPAGAIVIVAMLTLACALTLTGWTAYNDVGGEWLNELHEGIANVMLALVGVHIAGVIASSWLHRENLIGAMVSGRKHGQPGEGVKSAWSSVAALMLVAVLTFWWWQWHAAPAAPVSGHDAVSVRQTDRYDSDD